MEGKITDMDKSELVLYMKASREIYRFDEDGKAWQRAIKLYRETGNKFDADCTGCRKRLVEWLES